METYEKSSVQERVPTMKDLMDRVLDDPAAKSTRKAGALGTGPLHKKTELALQGWENVIDLPYLFGGSLTLTRYHEGRAVLWREREAVSDVYKIAYTYATSLDGSTQGVLFNNSLDPSEPLNDKPLDEQNHPVRLLQAHLEWQQTHPVN
jgi:hypothetical protein